MSVDTFAMTVSSDGRAKISASLAQRLGAEEGDVIEVTVEGKGRRAMITGSRVLTGRQAEAARSAARASRGEALQASRPKAAPKETPKVKQSAKSAPAPKIKRKTVVETERPVLKKGGSGGKLKLKRRS